MKILLMVCLLKVTYLRAQYLDALLEALLANQILSLTASDCQIEAHVCDPTYQVASLKIILVVNNNRYEYPVTVEGARNTLDNEAFNRTIKTTIYTPGYNSAIDDSLTRRYMTSNLNTNFFVVDTTVPFGGPFLSTDNYIRAAREAKCVGAAVALYLSELRTRGGVNPEKLHVIGSSLGAQASHYIALYFYQFLRELVYRVTGLDPARPCYAPVSNTQLHATDAKHVDVIHTDVGGLGTLTQASDADFFPNRGSKQPGAILLGSHGMCIDFYVESIDSPNCIAINLDNQETAQMGYRWNNERGKFSITTNAFSPYCKGIAGATGF